MYIYIFICILFQKHSMFFRKQYSRKICSTSFDCKVSFQDAAFLEQTGLLSNLKQPQRNVVFCCRLHFEIEDTSFLSASVGSVASCFLAVHVSLIFEMFIEGTSLTRTNKDKNSRHLGARVAYAYIYIKLQGNLAVVPSVHAIWRFGNQCT